MQLNFMLQLDRSQHVSVCSGRLDFNRRNCSRLKSHQEFYKLLVALGIGLGIAVKFVAILRNLALDIKLQFQQTGVYCLNSMADLEKQSLCLPWVRNKSATVFTMV